MRPDVRSDFTWQRELVPLVKQILANYLITEAPFEDDARRNTDFIVLKAEVTRVACRLRRDSYAIAYADEFTIRSRRPSGAETELSKLLSGWGDYLFYGFANDAGTALTAWTIGDLNVFRSWHSRALYRLPASHLPGVEKVNGDGSSKFRVYRFSDLPSEFIIARKPFKHEAA